MVMKAWANVFVVVLCAWVLWSGETRTNQSPILLTDIDEAYETLAECKKDQREILGSIKSTKTTKGIRTIVMGDTARIVTKDKQGNPKFKVSYRWTCLPGTVDPRPR